MMAAWRDTLSIKFKKKPSKSSPEMWRPNPGNVLIHNYAHAANLQKILSREKDQKEEL